MHMQSNNQGNEKVEYAPLNYSVSELYMIRKESIAYSNEFILRRLSRCFQKIKKMKATGREK
jgi:chitinase